MGLGAKMQKIYGGGSDCYEIRNLGNGDLNFRSLASRVRRRGFFCDLALRQHSPPTEEAMLVRPSFSIRVAQPEKVCRIFGIDDSDTRRRESWGSIALPRISRHQRISK